MQKIYVFLFFFVFLHCFFLCSSIPKKEIRAAKQFFDQQLLIKAMDEQDSLRINSEESVEKLITQSRDYLEKLYLANRPHLIHNFTDSNLYNPVTIGIILLGAGRIKNEYRDVFNFLGQIGLCVKEFDYVHLTLLQVFLYESVKLESNFYKLLIYKDYKDKLFEIIVTYYIIPEGITYLKKQQDQLKTKDKSDLRNKLLLENINLFLSKIPILNNTPSTAKKNSSFLSYISCYIPYLCACGIFLPLLYFLLKKPSSVN